MSEKPPLPKEWEDPEYRQAYMEAAHTQGMAYAIRINREKRGWTQQELADRSQTSLDLIQEIENPDNDGLYQLGALRKIANAFDIALRVDFTDYHVLDESRHRLSEDDLYIPPTSE